MEELALVTRKDVMAILGFKLLHGFNNLKKITLIFQSQLIGITAFQGAYVPLRKR